MRTYQELIRHEGNNPLFTAIEMSVASQVNGFPFHLHIEGVRGTGKTTIMRAAKQILPPMLRIKDCVYNCDPQAPHCPLHRMLSAAEIRKIGTEVVPRPFLEISHSAKIGTVVGSIDLGRLTDTQKAAAALLPGTIPKAHRGIIFIDEINRLADISPELADVLLDIMGTKPGRVQIEETGLPIVELPISVSIWAASNPDEDPGALQQIRRQLSDRFDCNIKMARPQNRQIVSQILTAQQGHCPAQEAHPLDVGNLHSVGIRQDITDILAAIYIDFGIESLRAVEALQTASRLAALQAGRQEVVVADISQVVPWVLGHRVDAAVLAKILSYLEQRQGNLSPVKAPESQSLPKDVINKQITNGWLKNLWTSFYRKISFSRGGMKIDNGGKQTGGNGEACAAAAACEEDSKAPPKNALPLDRLPQEKLVTTESDGYDSDNKAIL